jgi:putative membrane protein
MDGGALTRLPFITDTIGSLSRLPFVELAIGVPVGLIVFVSVVAVVRYVLSYSGFTLKRGDGSLHVSRGLLRTRQVTLDEKRLRGVELSEPWSLRLVGASAALAIMTGLGRERGAVALVSPPGPQQEVMATAEAVLGDTEPLHCELEPHGVRARRRRYTRAIWPIAVLAAAALVLEILGLVGPAVWLSFIAIVPASAALAWDRYRTLGHAILPRWIVTRHGSLGRKRAVLDREGVIGWNIRRSLFQRRAGLATLIVTTAAGRHSYSIPDLPMERVWPIIEEVSGARLASARA